MTIRRLDFQYLFEATWEKSVSGNNHSDRASLGNDQHGANNYTLQSAAMGDQPRESRRTGDDWSH